MNVVWLSLGLFFLFMILGVPIAMSIGLAAGASLLAMDTSLVVMAQKMFISTNSFTLIAIPFFMLVGAIMDRSGITEMLVNFAKACIGWIRYGMVYVTILAGILMGGMFIDGTPLIIMLVPLLYPVATAVGFDPLAFGIIICICNAMGAITPPVGAALFVACASGGVKLEKTFKYVYPIVIAELISIIILCIIPQLASFLPSVVGR